MAPRLYPGYESSCSDDGDEFSRAHPQGNPLLARHIHRSPNHHGLDASRSIRPRGNDPQRLRLSAEGRLHRIGQQQATSPILIVTSGEQWAPPSYSDALAMLGLDSSVPPTSNLSLHVDDILRITGVHRETMRTQELSLLINTLQYRAQIHPRTMAVYATPIDEFFFTLVIREIFHVEEYVSNEILLRYTHPSTLLAFGLEGSEAASTITFIRVFQRRLFHTIPTPENLESHQRQIIEAQIPDIPHTTTADEDEGEDSDSDEMPELEAPDGTIYLEDQDNTDPVGS